MDSNEKVLGGCAYLKAVVTGGKGYGISHSWDGSVLTVSSDSGSSSADLMGPAGTPMFVVEFRLEDGEYAADHSLEEVRAHIAAGELVMGMFVGSDSKTRCLMTTDTEYSVTFVMQSLLGMDEYFILTADGVTHMAAEANSGEEVPSRVEVVKADSVVTVTEVCGFSEVVTTIALDDDGTPVSVTKDGVTTHLMWEGFDA